MVNLLQQREPLEGRCVFEGALLVRQQGAATDPCRPATAVGAVSAGAFVKGTLPQQDGKILGFQFRCGPWLAETALGSKQSLGLPDNLVPAYGGQIVLPLVAFMVRKQRVFIEHLAHRAIPMFFHALPVLGDCLQ